MEKTEQNNFHPCSYNNKRFCFLQPPGSGPAPAPGILYERFKSAIEGLQFTCFDKVVLSAVKKTFPNLSPALNCKLLAHPAAKYVTIPDKSPASLNIGGVNSVNRGSVPFPNMRYQKIKHGEVITSGNGIKVILNCLDPGKPVKEQAREALEDMIRKGYIVVDYVDTGVVDAFLAEFRVSEIELNAFFTDPALFRVLKSETEWMSFVEAREYLRETGSKRPESDMARGANALRSLNRYEQSAYLWANQSSKLFAYNVTARAEKRDSHRPGDIFKIELTLRSAYMKAHPVDVGDLEGLLTDIRGTRLFRKARRMLLEPVEYALTRRQLLRGLKRRPTAGKPSAPRPVMPPRMLSRWKSGQISPNLIEFRPYLIINAPRNPGRSP